MANRDKNLLIFYTKTNKFAWISNFYYWGAANHSINHNVTWGEESDMQAQFAKLKTAYTSQAYPVIIGEYAGLQRTLGTGQDQTKHDASVKLFYQCVNAGRILFISVPRFGYCRYLRAYPRETCQGRLRLQDIDSQGACSGDGRPQ